MHEPAQMILNHQVSEGVYTPKFYTLVEDRLQNRQNPLKYSNFFQDNST